MSALRRWRVRLESERRPAILGCRDRADDENTRSATEGDGQEDHVVAGGGDHRRDRADDASLAGANRRAGIFGVVRRTEGKAESKTRAVGDSREGAAVVTGGVLRPEHTTFARKAERVTCHRAELVMAS
jgi:hypothetical protein